MIGERSLRLFDQLLSQSLNLINNPKHVLLSGVTFYRENASVPVNVFDVGDVVIVSTDTAIAVSQGIVR